VLDDRKIDIHLPDGKETTFHSATLCRPALGLIESPVHWLWRDFCQEYIRQLMQLNTSFLLAQNVKQCWDYTSAPLDTIADVVLS